MCELVTNVTFFVNRIIDHPIGCLRATPLPVYIKKKKSIIGLETEPNHNKRYNEDMCLFRCLALHRGCDLYRLEPAVKTLYEAYDRDHVPMEDFAGVTLDDLYRVETTFQTNMCVYTLVKPDAEDENRPPKWSVNRYAITPKQCISTFTRHIFHSSKMYSCTATRIDVGSAVTHYGKMPGRYVDTSARVRVVYHSTPSVFERLDDENIRVAESLRYYPYRATFDFECWFDTEQLPSDSDKVHWVARHVPLSVSVASNVPGHEQVQCLVTDGDTNKLVSRMMDILRAMSDAAYDKIKDSYEDVLEQLAEALMNWDEREEAARSAVDKDSRPPTNPYKKLMGQLYGWMHQLPVIGFNSGKYDLNAIKQFLILYFLSTSKTGEQEEEEEEQDDKEEENEGIGSFFVIKRNNTFMCLSTDQLKFLDMTNYIAPGFSYDKYLKAYGCEVTKGHFPYEYMDRLERLDNTALPTKEAFFSRPKNEGISDEEYASCQGAWCDNGMTTLRDFFVWYKSTDVVPFLQAIDTQFAFYQQCGVDMFKQGISVPGLTLLYLSNDLPEKTYFTLFNKNHLVKDHVVGGASLIFHRYHEKRVTTLRQNEYGKAARPCRSIVGYDANALYLWSLK